MLTVCTSFLSNTTLFSGITNIVYVSAATTAQTSELSQKGKNIQTMLNTSPDNCYTYWNYFADSKRYPYYIYLDNYYSGKDTLPLLKGAASFFRVNIAPSLIDIGDKIYNDDGLSDQSQLRAREILISMIKDKGKDIFDDEAIDQQLDRSKDLIESFDNFIKADKEVYNKLFDGRYEKLEAFNKKIEEYLKSAAKKGVKLTPKVLIQSEEFMEISKNTNKMELLEKFDKEMANIYKVSSLIGKFGTGLEAVSFLKDASDEYFELRKVLQANNDFINFLDILENNASEKAVRAAAKDLKETYQNHLKGQLQAIKKLGLGEVESYIKGLSWQVSVTNLSMNTAFKVGDKIEKFDKLRLSSNMASALDKVMSDNINQYNAAYDTTEKNKSADSIYKYAPYLFALRLEGENNLYEYLKLIGADENEIVKNKNSDINYIETIYNTFYQNIRPSADFSDLKEKDEHWKQDSKGWWYQEGNSWVIGWKLIDNKWYYFYSDGYMAHDTTIGGYYLNSSGVCTTSMKVGDYIQFGKYLGKPILWKVISNDKDGVTIMSDKIICFKPFDAAESGTFGALGEFGNSDWGKSNLREWLNSEDELVKYSTVPPISKALFRATDAYDKEPGFLSNFTREEINNIKVHNTVYTDHQKSYDVSDRVFLLSDKDIKEKYKIKSYGAYPTKEAIEKLNWKDSGITTYTRCTFWQVDWFWPFPTSCGINLIWDEECLQADGNGGGVVPIISLSSSSVKSGKGTEVDPYVLDTQKNKI